MKKLLPIIVIAVIALGAIGFAMSRPDTRPATNTATPSADNTQADNTTNRSSETSQATQNTTRVTMKDLAFSPKTIQVKVGDTVTWTNEDSAKHDIMPDTESEDFKASELLAKGESYSFTFKKAGTYTYHCTPHPFMKATVIVE